VTSRLCEGNPNNKSDGWKEHKKKNAAHIEMDIQLIEKKSSSDSQAKNHA